MFFVESKIKNSSVKYNDKGKKSSAVEWTKSGVMLFLIAE